eukprot:COSAG02_NODE_28330_length_591_cov_1.406504_2_plen_23_part_01
MFVPVPFTVRVVVVLTGTPRIIR